MPRRTGQLTLTDIRRRYDAERLIGCKVTKAGSYAEAWKMVFPESTANHHCAQNLGSRLCDWYGERFPEDARTLFGRMRMRRQRLPRGFKPRSKAEHVGAAVIFCYVVLRLPLVECWRRVAPESTASANSARNLAQRYATRLIRKYPDAPRQIIEGSIRTWVKLFPEAKIHFRGGHVGSYEAVPWPFYCSVH